MRRGWVASVVVMVAWIFVFGVGAAATMIFLSDL